MKLFNFVPTPDVPKSAFDLSHERKTAMRFGELVPVLVQEVLPNDTFHIDTQSMVRFMPMITPAMQRYNSFIHYFYVPNRLLWDGWEKFITGDSQTVVPVLTVGDTTTDSLANHLGIPIGEWGDDDEVSALPFRAYLKIWNDMYRDENLQTEIDISVVGDGAIYSSTHDIPLKIRSYEKDYFTSALPWVQKGNPVFAKAGVTYKTDSELSNEHSLVASPTGNFSAGTNTGPRSSKFVQVQVRTIFKFKISSL